jgi:hypothetical protein
MFPNVPARSSPMEITGVFNIYFPINGTQMEAPFLVTPEASSNIFGMYVIKKYRPKMDFLTTTVTASLAHVAALKTEEDYNVKVHRDITVEA